VRACVREGESGRENVPVYIRELRQSVQRVRESSLGHHDKGTGTRATYRKATFPFKIKKEPQADRGS